MYTDFSLHLATVDLGERSSIGALLGSGGQRSDESLSRNVTILFPSRRLLLGNVGKRAL